MENFDQLQKRDEVWVKKLNHPLSEQLRCSVVSVSDMEETLEVRVYGDGQGFEDFLFDRTTGTQINGNAYELVLRDT